MHRTLAGEVIEAINVIVAQDIIGLSPQNITRYTGLDGEDISKYKNMVADWVQKQDKQYSKWTDAL